MLSISLWPTCAGPADEPLEGAAAIEALRALGYTHLESESALRAARREIGGDADTEELIRAALRHM